MTIAEVPYTSLSKPLSLSEELINTLKVEETVGSQNISCGIALTPIDRFERRRVVTERYIERGYITDDKLSTDGTFIDLYEEYCIPLVAKKNGEIVASMRLIPNTTSGLPVNNEKIALYQECESARNVPFEVSQLAKSKIAGKDPRPTLGIIRTYMQILRQIGETESIAVIDQAVREQLNGPYTGFGLPQIGPSVFYMGSDSQPIYIDINSVVSNSNDNGHAELARFLNGENKVPGFEWYVGP